MPSPKSLKSADFYRKIPYDLTEASLSGAGLSIVAALAIFFLFGMELSHYLTMSTTTTVVVDKSSDAEFLRMEFNISFPALSCEFASVDVSDVLGTDRINVTKTVSKIAIDSRLRGTGDEFHAGSMSHEVKHDKDGLEETVDGAVPLKEHGFDDVAHAFPILVVNFYAPWCYHSRRLNSSWERAAKVIRERYNPKKDGRILIAKVDCTEERPLCERHNIQGYPSILIFRRGSDDARGDQRYAQEAYYGDRDTESLVKAMALLVEPIQSDSKIYRNVAIKRPAPSSSGCRVEGFVRVNKVPGNLVISARSSSHSFDASQMNMSHVISHMYFGKKITPKDMTNLVRLLPYLGQNHDLLSGKSYISSPIDTAPNITIEHYLQVVKTEVITRAYKLEEYEYTAHSSLVHSQHIPVAKFHFDPSPMQVLVTEDRKPFAHFITTVCAIIGGVFTVAGIVDSVLYNAMRVMRRIELGQDI